jgi:hypothetical protein
MKRLKPLAVTLALLAFIGIFSVRAEEQLPDDGGALEHYHHEYYSHSYVDPNYHDGQSTIDSGKLSNSKKGRNPGKSTIALGGHRRHHRP